MWIYNKCQELRNKQEVHWYNTISGLIRLQTEKSC